VPPGIAAGELLSSWLNPTSAMSGLLAVVTAAYLAAVYLTRDAERGGEPDLAGEFRRRALATGEAAGALSAAGLVVLRTDSLALFDQLTTGRALPCVVVSVLAGVTSLLLLWRRAYVAARPAAALAVAGLIWGWGAGQYPQLLPGVDAGDAAATDAVLSATLGALAIGALLLVPSLWWLYRTFQRAPAE
jgi:cytochrome bd ubiquinol oxidase subunit II